MTAPSTPFEIARETLKQLALRRIPPTPDHYRTLYNEILGQVAEDDAVPEKFLLALAQQLPRDNTERQRLARELDQALATQSAQAGREALWQYLAALKLEQQPAWNELISQLLRQWEARHAGWTTARKRDSLEHVLSASNPEALFSRLQSLVRSWTQTPAEPAASETAAPTDLQPAPAPAAPHLLADGEAGELAATLRDLLRRTLREVVPASIAEQPELIREADAIASTLDAAENLDQLRLMSDLLRRFAFKLEMATGEAAEVQTGLLNLLRLLLENIDELVLDDQWLHGQVEILRGVLDTPANLRQIDDAERRLKEVIYKQSQLKHNLSEAQQAIKTMIAGFIDQLADFAENTDSYHDAIGQCAQQVSAARDISEIGSVLDEVMRQTRSMQIHAVRSRDDLLATRHRADEAEARVIALQQELDETSRLITLDPLTGALNRRGLEDLFEKESGRATRRHGSLCVALLDVDNFKQINDTFGHQKGDEALVHLVKTIRDNLRPQDSVARYGGEEFILLYPEATLEEAAAALTRLQRALTSALFLLNDQKVLITFSAGVTQWQVEDSLETVAERADKAMYRAKLNGKNRVEIVSVSAG